MPVPPIPPPLEALRNRPFSFYPAILNIEHNEWRYRKSTWTDVLVVNARTGQEIWIPRRFLGEISRIEDPVVIVGLIQELEYEGDAIVPYQRRVIEMPLAVGSRRPAAVTHRAQPAPVVAIRLESKTDSHLFRVIGGVLVTGIVAAYFIVNIYRDAGPRPRIVYTSRDRSYLGLTAQDDYHSIVRKLGPPAHEHSQGATTAIQYRALTYPDRKYTVILMSVDEQRATYIGAVDENWNPIHDVVLPGGSSEPLLRGLHRF